MRVLAPPIPVVLIRRPQTQRDIGIMRRPRNQPGCIPFLLRPRTRLAMPSRQPRRRDPLQPWRLIRPRHRTRNSPREPQFNPRPIRPQSARPVRRMNLAVTKCRRHDLPATPRSRIKPIIHPRPLIIRPTIETHSSVLGRRIIEMQPIRPDHVPIILHLMRPSRIDYHRENGVRICQ